MLGDLRLAPLRTAGIELPNSFGKPSDVPVIQLRPVLGGARAPRLPCGGIRRALLLRLLEGVLLDQQPLALISLACPTPFQNHRGEPRVLAGAARQGGVTRREEYEVVQVGAGEAQGPSLIHERDPGAMPEIFAALVAPAVSVGNKDLEVAAGSRLHVERDYAARGKISASIFVPKSSADSGREERCERPSKASILKSR
jgi:hypothetical protein